MGLKTTYIGSIFAACFCDNEKTQHQYKREHAGQMLVATINANSGMEVRLTYWM